jgi:SAM-dependent methyltransferase
MSRDLLPLRRVDPGELACPVCKGPLDAGPGVLTCPGCPHAYPQPRDGFIDLMPPWWRAEPARWGDRQVEMERAYRELIADEAHAILAYRNDFGPFEPRLADCAGRVLDLGGGNGLLRHFLPAVLEYVVADPSTSWLSGRWRSVASTFPGLNEPLAFVRAAGEALPFPAARFDVVLSFWSLNHAVDPEAILGEVHRVLAPGGRLYVVLDDVPPSWGDVLSGRYRDARLSVGGLLTRKLAATAGGWPVQPDHLRISRRRLARAARGFACAGREWVGTYLALDLRKRQTVPTFDLTGSAPGPRTAGQRPSARR